VLQRHLGHPGEHIPIHARAPQGAAPAAPG
jgi:hypothetical protein